MGKQIIIKFLALGIIITLLNVIYSHTLYPKDMKRYCGEVIKIKSTQQQTDIYYFGESSNVTYHPADSIQNSISEICNFFFPTLKITNINKYATHSGIYRHWINNIDLAGKNPKALIITLNLRSFDAAWRHSKLETQLQESMVLTRPYPHLVNRFFLSLQVFDHKTEQEREKDMLEEWRLTELKFPFNTKYKTVRQWDDAMANGGYKKPDGSWDTDKITLACHYIKAYAFNLNEENTRVKDFDAIVDWCNSNNINLYLNLMAENVMYADSLVGSELTYLLKENRDYLVKRYNKGKCRVVDNLEAVKGSEFIDQNWTTEHYKYKGRMIIARNLARAMKEQFKNEYKEVY